MGLIVLGILILIAVFGLSVEEALSTVFWTIAGIVAFAGLIFFGLALLH